jgi:general secretion pathway protein L
MLIIGLPHDALNDTCTQVFSEDGLRVQGSGLITPAECAAGELIVAIVPHTRLSWHAVRVPPVAASQRQAAVIGLLEDRWLQPPGELHLSLFPIADATPDGPNFWVCACDAAWLRQALQPWMAAGRMPQKLMPEFAPAANAQTETVHWLGPAERGQIVWCRAQGVLAASAPPPWPLLQSTPVQTRAEPDMVELAHAHHGTPDAPASQTQAERWLLAASGPWDLAQGVWSQTPLQKRKRQAAELASHLWHHPSWRSARRALLALILIQAMGLLSWAWLMNQELASQRRELAAVLTQSFAQTTVVINAPLQMSQGLHHWRQSLGEAHPGQPETMLAHIMDSLAAPQAVQALRFDGRTLTLKGPTLAAIPAQQQQRLQSLGYGIQATGDGLSLSWSPAP